MKVGILGGGQLARMIALAGYPLGIRFIFLDPSVGACATTLGSHLHGDYHDENLLAELAKRADVVTYEFENVPAKVASFLESHTQVYPPAKALAVAQDRLVEKNFLNDLGIPTAPYADITTFESLQTAMEKIGYPAILKTRTQGYDGKGQSVLKSAADLKSSWQKLEGLPAIVEGFVNFKREVSIIAVRSVSGELAFYPLSENVHKGGILRVSESRENDAMQTKAEDYATRLMKALDYVGVLALELFEVDGELVANEFAPRVHNSGHWTIEGAETSQFENHLRAILDLPLGSTAAVGNVAMVNFIGGKPENEDVLKIPNTHLHLYGKAPRKGRKIAHATIRAKTVEELEPLKKRLVKLADEADDS
ncbi:MAG: 5-(carboxyamino)imidazole ribonucleotide synthase [Methylococcales bacterium]|nr:5-(carboxyamino)imidazole ribonucleotide synthase [Methylococcales bacterium]